MSKHFPKSSFNIKLFENADMDGRLWWEWGVASDYQDLAPENFRICSNESQKLSDQGAIRIQQGIKPL